MAEKTGIEWTDHTFNIAWGCVKVSPGCKFCYADRDSRRYGFDVFGPAATTARRTFGDRHWRAPLEWQLNAECEGVRRRVFCSSMCDVFEDHPTINTERAKLWPLIRATPWLDWQLLTKRPERIEENLPGDWGAGYPNVWLGTSVENNDYVERARLLAKIPAALRFLSCEPLIGHVDLRQKWFDVLKGWDVEEAHSSYCSPERGCSSSCPECEQVQTYGIQWVIAGGESEWDGKRRYMDLDWARSLRDQCAAAGVAFFLKQLGGPPAHKRGGDEALLDGRRHTDMPVAA